MPRDRRAPAERTPGPAERRRGGLPRPHLRSDGLLEPARARRRGRGRGRGPHPAPSPTTTRWPGTASWSRRARRRCPPASTLIPGVEINATVADVADLPGRASSTSSASAWTPTTRRSRRVLERQRGARRRAVRAMLARLREAGMPVDAQLAGLDRRDEDVARAARRRPGAGRGRLRATSQDAFDRLVGHGRRATCRARRIGPGRGDRRDPRRRRPAVAGPLRRRRPSARRLLRELIDGGPRRPRGPPPQLRRRDRRARCAPWRPRHRLVATGGTDFHGDEGTYAEAHRRDVGPRRRGRRHAGGPRDAGARRDGRRPMSRARAARPRDRPAAGRGRRRRAAAAPADARLAEFRPEDQALPRFWVWTLGCQMNRSDSEEMAGRLLAAGCAEAPSMEAADLVVINTCAIREAAEAKVIGRQGHLARLKAAEPGNAGRADRLLRPRARPGRAWRAAIPAVDLFLRPDEEPELVDRLGLASAQAPVGLAAGDGGDHGREGRRRSPRPTTSPGARGGGRRAAPCAADSADRAWLPIIYGCDKTCTYCIVPFSRGPERSRPFDEIVDEARALAAAGYREVTLLGQNVNSYGHDLPAEARFAHVARGALGGPPARPRRPARTSPS